MSESIVTVSAVTPDQITAYVNGVKHDLDIAATISKFTPTQVDDKLVAYAQTVVSQVEPYVEDPHFAEVVNFFLDLFQTAPGKIMTALEAAKSAVANHED